jgi:hypothetical protein
MAAQPAAAKKARDLQAEMAFLTRALKAPTLRESVERLAERARAETWSHEEFLVACLQREVAARDAHGGEGRIRAARLPARKSLEEFDFDHARGLKRDTVAHLGTLDFIAEKGNIVFLGPPGTKVAGLVRAQHPRLVGGDRFRLSEAATWGLPGDNSDEARSPGTWLVVSGVPRRPGQGCRASDALGQRP